MANVSYKKWVFWPLEGNTQTNTLLLDQSRDPDTFHHLVKVNRLQVGKVLAIIKPEQDLSLAYGYITEVISINKNSVELKVIQSIQPQLNRQTPHLVALVSVLKQEPFEWLLEKLTELGVHQIIAYQSDRTQPHFSKKDPEKTLHRFEQIMKNAASQCERWYWPELEWPQTSLKNLLTHKGELINKANILKFVAVERQDTELTPIQTLLAQNVKSCNTVFFAVGPEGGFTDNDLQWFDKYQFTAVTLGQNILRAETASVMLLSCIQANLI